MFRAIWRFGFACEPVCEDFTPASRFLALQGLEDNVVPILRKRRSIPRTVKSNEHAISVAGGELTPSIKQQSIWTPVRWEYRDRCFSIHTESDCLPTVASILRRENQLGLHRIV